MKTKAKRIVFGGCVLLLAVFAAGSAFPEVSVNINIGPPAVVVAEPPEMIVIPQTMVYFAPGVGVDLFFHAGFWWTPKEGRWFRAHSYNGPWVIVAPRAVPVSVVRVPRDYRKVYARGHRVPYGQLKKHYSYRERERREHRGEWKEDRKEHRKAGKENWNGHGKGKGR